MDRDDLIDEYSGKRKDLVPDMEPGEYCNAKCLRNDKETFDRYCSNVAGKGTDHVGEMRCKYHAGATMGTDKGAPEKNQNSRTHGLQADPSNYEEHLSESERTWVFETREALLDRIRAGKGDVDPIDRILAHRVVVKLNIVANASEYVERQGLMEQIWTSDGQIEVKNRLMEELRRYDNEILYELKELGVLDDPETKKADALTQWRQFIDQ